MTIRVTMLKNGFDPYGNPLTAGVTYPLADEFAKSLILSLQASDTDGVLRLPANTPFDQYPITNPALNLTIDAASGTVTAGGEPVGRGVMCSGGSGVTSDWVAAAPYGERFALELLVATGGAAASLTLDGSNDGVTSSGQIATASLDTTGVTTITPPIKSIYPYIRWTIVGAGSGSVRISRGV